MAALFPATRISAHTDKAQLLPPHIRAKLLHLKQHPSCATGVLGHQPLLGVMAGLLDQIASTHVFGNHGSKGRPRGLVTLKVIHDMEQHQRLSSSSKHSWHQFLQVWHKAGWGRFDVLVMVDELRPLLWQYPQCQDHTASINAQELAVYCAEYSRRQGHRQLELQKSLLNFLDVVQNHFSAPSAVLLPAQDVYTRLSSVDLSVYVPQL
ncbi:hypothetical protein ABBQ38_003597 [Trebouxia sp. C0009 RCD-2024]